MALGWCFSLSHGVAVGIGCSSLFSLMLILERSSLLCGRCFDLKRGCEVPRYVRNSRRKEREEGSWCRGGVGRRWVREGMNAPATGDT